ncbi:Aldo/keto reductase family-domain-containing protein [Dactylonectria estremocensis]|uniref:Aldo/keto reductase family-domain-containing protein n=1 Tax=Dactylonectria estremocensis TaxID=1079267 RepID=A0A9P9J038_9HYPO|nr:Aldo/keto reductase family-domain-containing protein [Dactylonectria estremocensis]
MINKNPPLVIGGAGFSYQLHPDPESLPIRQILLRAFEQGLCTIDTSPYYEPSEQLMGAALSHPEITSKFSREDIVLMTKVGRIKENEFDYSPAWVRKSVAQSLERFRTTYLDVVFCHDVEFVSREEAVVAVGVLFDLRRAGVIRRVGISGYEIDNLAHIAKLVQQRYGNPLDVIQTWAQLTLQNTQVEQRGLDMFRAAGVTSVLCSSPLAVGLLRNGGIPAGLTGDWHPAPHALRTAVQNAAEWVEQQGESMASIALRFAIAKATQGRASGFTISTIVGISTMSDLEKNIATAKQILTVPGKEKATMKLNEFTELDETVFALDQPLYDRVRAMLGRWVDYDFQGKQLKSENCMNGVHAEKRDTEARHFETELLPQGIKPSL